MPAIRPATYFAAAALAFVLAFHLWITPKNPPGFHHDEVAFALNAYTIAHHLRDQDGGFLPVVFPSYGDYKSALFSYAEAPAVAVFGPKPEVARSVAAVFGLLGVALIGLLAYRRAGPVAAVLATVLAGLTPWLFEVGRVAYDWSTFPFDAALVLVAVDFWARSSRSLVLRAGAVGIALSILTYAYSGGRLLGPLLAAALIVFLRRRAWRDIAAAWVAFGVFLMPLFVYWVDHSRGLTARYDQTRFNHKGITRVGIVLHGLHNVVSDLNPWHWLVSGDPKPYVDVQGQPQLLGVSLLLALAGAVIVLRRPPWDRFWLFVLLGYVLSVVPASLTVDRHDSTRLSAMPVFLLALAIPALGTIARLRPRMLAATAAAVAVAALVQWTFFVVAYANDGPNRGPVFDADVPAILVSAFAGTGPVVMDHDDAYARTYATWYAIVHHIPVSRVVRLPDGGVPPTGSMVFGRTQDCDYVCVRLENADTYWIARAEPAG